MYGDNHCLAIFYVSLDSVLRALSFRTIVTPQPSSIPCCDRGFMNSVTCALGGVTTLAIIAPNSH